jgi:hypothetical protein
MYFFAVVAATAEVCAQALDLRKVDALLQPEPSGARPRQCILAHVQIWDARRNGVTLSMLVIAFCIQLKQLRAVDSSREKILSPYASSFS